MKQVYACDLLASVLPESLVSFYGWVKGQRRCKTAIFLDVCDSTGTVQVVVDRSNQPLCDVAQEMSQETAVRVIGPLKENAKARSREIWARTIEIVGPSQIDVCPYPRSDIDIFDPRLQNQLLHQRHFYLRNERIASILRFRHIVTWTIHQWFRAHGYTELHAPILTPTPLYEDRTAIPVRVHKQDLFLTQCVGFYMEHAVHALERIYNLGPSFRAEETHSKRHLIEYWHVKAEIAFAHFEDLFSVVEQFVSDVVKQCVEEGAELGQRVGYGINRDGLSIPFPRIEYCDAIDWLRSEGFSIDFGRSLGSAEETCLARKFGNSPFWVVGNPRSVEPFPYEIRSDDPRRTLTADLICSRGYGELLGIARKIHDLAAFDERLKEKGKGNDPRYDWLRDLRRYGCVPHGGFGMGLERLVRWLLLLPHVRDAIPFPRLFGRRIYP